MLIKKNKLCGGIAQQGRLSFVKESFVQDFSNSYPLFCNVDAHELHELAGIKATADAWR